MDDEQAPDQRDPIDDSSGGAGVGGAGLPLPPPPGRLPPGLPPPPGPGWAPEPSGRRRGRNGWTVAGVVLAAVLAALGLLLLAVVVAVFTGSSSLSGNK